MRGVNHSNLELGVLQETKITDGVYTHRLAGYSVVATYAPSQHRSGMVVLYQASPRFLVEEI